MEEKQIEFSGFLFQKAVFNRWNKRFVKLTKNGKLLIFKDKNDTKTKHEMDVTNYEVKTVPVSKFKKQNVFFLGMNISKGKKKKIYFSCSSEKEKNDWLEMINNVLHKRQDNYRPSLSLKSLQSLSPSSIKLHYSKQQNNQNNQSTTVSPTSTSKTALDYTDDESEFGQEVPNFIEDEMDWNETLRLLLQQLPPQRTYEKFYEIHENVQHEISILQLLGNFLHTAAYCAQILIDEYPLKKSQKIIKPIFNENCDPKQKNFLMEKEHFEEDQIPGIQYETSNMIFRFYHRYPGKLESTELSMKMANHLVQNGKFIQEANIIGVYVPLQCIVDYKGFRIHVSAQLPNNKRRVKLGEVVSPKIKKKLKDLLQKYCLNLDMENVDLLEVLEISENEIYLLNVEQLFPTEKFNYEDPIINLLKKDLEKEEYKMVSRIRPELLRKIGKIRMKNIDNEKNIDISQFARDHLYSYSLPKFISKMDNLEVIVVDSQKLKDQLHLHGINIRHLGVLANLTKIPHVRQLLVIEMIARVCKKSLYEQLRKTSKRIKNIESTEFANLVAKEEDKEVIENENGNGNENGNEIQNENEIQNGNENEEIKERKPEYGFQTPKKRILKKKTTDIDLINDSIEKSGHTELDSPRNHRVVARINERMASIIIDFFNLVLGSSEECEMYWDVVLIPGVLKKFGFKADFSMIHKPALFLALQFHSGVEFVDTDEYDFSKENPIERNDFVAIHPKLKIFYNQKMLSSKFAKKYDKFSLNNEYNNAIQSLNVELAIQKSVYGIRTMQVSRILTKLSAIYFQKKDLSNSVLCANAALGASRKFYGDIAVTYLALMKAKYQSGDMKSALECFKYSMNILHYHLSENHPLLIDSYNEIAHLYQRDGNIQYALKFFTKALELCKKVLGGGHWKTAWCFFNVGRCHSQSTNFQEALVMMENGLVIISSLFGEKRLATSIFHFYAADILIKKGDLSTAKEHSMKSLETQKYVNQLVQESNQLRTNGIVSTFKDSLENQSLKRNQAQIEDVFRGCEKKYNDSEINVLLVKNILQVAYVHENLSEFLEANDFYQSALEILKDMEEDNVLEQIQHITRTVLNLQFKMLSLEKQYILEKIKVDQIQGKSQTLKFPITKELFEMVVIELFDQDSLKVYVDSLFDCVVQNGDKEALKKLKSLYLISIGEDLTMFN